MDISKKFNEHDATIKAFVRSRVRDENEVNDVMQEVWKAAIKKVDSYDPKRPFGGWIFGMARLQVLKWRQKKARSKEIISSELIEQLGVNVDKHAHKLTEMVELLMSCLKDIDIGSRTLLTMKYYDGMSAEQMGNRLGKSPDAISMSMTRARRELKKLMTRKMGECT